MGNRILVLVVCVAANILLHAGSATDQQPIPLLANPATANPVTDNPVTANPIDPASLNAPPAFGDSAPVEKKPVETPTLQPEPLKSPAAAETVWKPKLRVVLVTKSGTLNKSLPYHAGEVSRPFFSDDSVSLPKDGNRTASKVTEPAQPFAILMCDEVTVDAKALETGELAYSFSCKGKVILKIDDYTVTGDSISSDEAKLTISNAVVKSNKATLTAEKVQIQLLILGVRVEPNSAEPNGGRDSLQPVPDATLEGSSDILHFTNQ